MLSLLLYILIWLLLVVVGSFIPIGNENSTVRRLPVVTFAIMGLCVLVYYVTLPGQVTVMKEIVVQASDLEKFMSEHTDLIYDEEVQNRMVAEGLATKEDVEEVKVKLRQNPELKRWHDSWVLTVEAKQSREQFFQKLDAVLKVRDTLPSYKFGLAPNGHWKIYQPITSAFMHGGMEHLFGNMIFFFAIAFVLEDLWGRSVFTSFYILGAIVSTFPFIFSPSNVPLIGASGAISATMGAFLIRLPKTKIKLLFWPSNFLIFLLAKKKRTIMVPSYVVLLSFFIENLILWYFTRGNKGGGTAFSAHIAGFVFGAGFALMMKAGKIEETHINPKIEAKVSFEAPVAVTQGLEMMDKGQTDMAERKLRTFMMQQPDNLETILALIQVYQKTSNYDQLNAMYGRLLRYHLNKNDREAALYAYDSLLSAFPDNQINVRIPPRDWIAICDFLSEMQMHREASVEYERLVKAWPEDANSVRAAVLGAEAAFMVQDIERALGLFEIAEKLNTSQAFAHRINTGAEKCRRILANRPDWKRKKPKAPAMT
jgi:membrane associated rhomboid family serine protease